jgi:hypothetical protein
MGVLCTHSPKSLGPFPKLPIKNGPKCRRKHQKNLKILKKKGQANPIQASTAAGGQPLVTGRPWANDLESATSGQGPVARPRPSPDRWSPAVRRPGVVGPGLGGNQRSPTGGLMPGQGRSAPFFLNFFFVLPSTFCASSQLLLVGSSTCPPYP